MSLHRCEECGQYTKKAPFFSLRDWRYQGSVCIDCYTDIERVIYPLHRAPLFGVLAALVSGNWQIGAVLA